MRVLKINEKMPFKLFPCCISVRGLQRSIIYDLNRNEFTYIPNDLHIFLSEHQGKSFNDIISNYTNKNKVRITVSTR